MSTAAVSTRPGVLADRLVRRSSVLTDLALVLSGTVVVALMAQVTIPLWPVPITGQTLAVMVVGGALGLRRGAAALSTYLLAGLAGAPVFAGGMAGPAYLLSPTFGFIIGFIGAAALAGWAAERAWDRHVVLAMVGFGLATAVPFIFGVPWMAAVLGMSDPAQILAAGVTPFIVPGLIKAGIAALAFPLVWQFVRHVDTK